jgi:hypothetical protein
VEPPPTAPWSLTLITEPANGSVPSGI